MTELKIRAISLGFSAFMYSAVAVFVTSNLDTTVLTNINEEWLAILQIAAGTISIFVVYFFIYSILISIWSRGIIGEWAYESDSGNFGIVVIGQKSGVFSYRVELYRDKIDIMKALKGKPSVTPFAHVYSKMSVYTGEDFITDYIIDRADPNYARRKGLLEIVPRMAGEGMTGFWYTILDPSTPSGTKVDKRHGNFTLYRVSDFLAVYS